MSAKDPPAVKDPRAVIDELLQRKPFPTWVGILLAVAAVAVIFFGFLGPDRWVYENVARKINTDGANRNDFYQTYRVWWELARVFGHAVGGVIAIGICAVVHRLHGRAALVMLLGILAGVLPAIVLQGGIGRVRPNQADLTLETPPQLQFHWPPLSGIIFDQPDCFPSGEGMKAFALAGTLGVLFPRYWLLFVLMVLVTPAQRVLSGAHYFSDVIASALVALPLGRLVAKWALRRMRSWLDQRVSNAK